MTENICCVINTTIFRYSVSLKIMLFKLSRLIVAIHCYFAIVRSQKQPLNNEPHNPYTSRTQTCGGIVIWPSKPFILTRNKLKGEHFPREQCVRHFVEDLESIVNKTSTELVPSHFWRRRRKRQTPTDDLISKVCNDKSSTGNPWEEDIPRTAFRMLRGFLGICNRLQETKTLLVDEKKEDIPTENNQNVKEEENVDEVNQEEPEYAPEDVVMEIKKDPFDEPKAEVWDFVEPDDTETVSSDKSLPGVTMVGTTGDETFVDPFEPATDDGFKIVLSRDGEKVVRNFSPLGVDGIMSKDAYSSCTDRVDRFWLRDLVEYMGDDCWVLGKFARKYYPCVHCKPGICFGHNRLFGKKPMCFPGVFSTHTSWLYCPHLGIGERFRKFSFNLAQNCGCRTC